MRAARAVVGIACALSLSGCFMSDPEPPVAGFRMVDGGLEAVLPLCTTEQLVKVEGADVTKRRKELFVAEGATTPEVRSGRLTVLGGNAWVPNGFTRRTVFQEPAGVPELLEMSYRDARGNGTGHVAEMGKISAAVLQPDQFWTRTGPMTAEAIRGQLACNRTAS